jgi:hypothetical protein
MAVTFMPVSLIICEENKAFSNIWTNIALARIDGMDFALHTLDFRPVWGEKFLQNKSDSLVRCAVRGIIQEGGKPGE